MDPDEIGRRVVELLGEPAAVELLAVLELPEAERATLIGAVYHREGGQVPAELLADVEADPDDLALLRLIGALRGLR